MKLRIVLTRGMKHEEGLGWLDKNGQWAKATIEQSRTVEDPKHGFIVGYEFIPVEIVDRRPKD